jgi:hypothetical protein
MLGRFERNRLAERNQAAPLDLGERETRVRSADIGNC